MLIPNPDEGKTGFVVRDPAFQELIGPHATIRRLHRDANGTQLFHEAGIYLASQNAVYLTSNRLPYAPARQRIAIVRVPLEAIPPVTYGDAPGVASPLDAAQAERFRAALEVAPEGEGGLPQHLAMPNGATRWVDADGREGVLWCEQGRHNLDGQSDAQGGAPECASALVAFTPGASIAASRTTPLLTSYAGKPFTSLNDVVVHEQSGVVFFTDPDYGLVQSFKRTHDELREHSGHGYAPNALYAWYPPTGEVRLLDDRYDKPNGVTFVPDPSAPTSGRGHLVTTDTGAASFTRNASMGSFHVDASRPARTFVYAVEPASSSSSSSPASDSDPFPRVDVPGRAHLWDSEAGFPDGVHPDERGNVWVGHGDGVHVYDPRARTLIGKVVLPGGDKGVANFCWAGSAGRDPQGREMYRMLFFAEDELWEVCVGVNGRD